jgi:hypothetical protein
MFGWFIPHFQMSWAFTATVSLALALEAVTTWVPQTHGWRLKTHYYASYGVALLIPIVLVMIALSSHISELAVLLIGVPIAVMLAFMFIFLFVRSQRKYYLIYQTIYVICFFTGILLTGLFG